MRPIMMNTRITIRAKMSLTCPTSSINNSKDPDELFPDLEAVDDLDFGDLSRLENDDLYTAGMREVQGILHEMSEIGRTRKQFSSVHSLDSCISRDQHQVGEPHGLKEECKDMEHIGQGESSVLSLEGSVSPHLGRHTCRK